jgi:hypothetical protein
MGRTIPKAEPAGTADSTNLRAEVIKTAATTVVAALLGYLGAFVMPPTELYDRVFRQDPNNMSGTWVGEINGWPSRMQLQQLSDHRYFTGTLAISPLGQGVARTIQVNGTRDSAVTIVGRWDGTHILKVALQRRVSERTDPDAGLVILGIRDRAPVAATLCSNDELDIRACPPLGDGAAYFAKGR